MGRKKNPSTDNPTPSEVASTQPNRSQLIREALDAGIESPSEIVKAIQEKHGLEIKPGLVSIVKNKWKNDKGGKAKVKSKPGRKAKASPSKGVATSTAGGSVSIDDLLVLKGLVTKHGVAGIGRLLEVIA